MSDSLSRRPPVCFVTAEFQGLPGSGGIGTAFAGLAVALVEAGHPVTVLCTAPDIDKPAFEATAAQLRAQGIDLLLLPDGPAPQGGGHWSELSYRVFRWLSERSFGVVHFHDWGGLGHWATAAKRQGLAFASTTLAVGLHGPSRWARSAAHSGLQGIEELEIDLIERGSIEQADAVVSPSAYMLDWVRRAGWRLPADALVVPNILPPVPVPAAERGPLQPVREIVFFGRLEGRKGVTLFCDAMDRMAARLGNAVRVTFLGRTAPVGGEDGASLVRRRAAAWPMPVSLIGDLSSAEALAYLAGEGRLAVIPSLGENLPCTVAECIALGLPFLASAVGGIPELIDDRDLDRVLFAPAPEALAAGLVRALDEGAVPARPRHAVDETIGTWLTWHIERSAQRQHIPHSVNIARDAAQDGDYVLIAGADATVSDEALARIAVAAAATGAAVLAGALETAEGCWLAPTASPGLAPFRDVAGLGPLVVRRDRASAAPSLSAGAARQEWLARALFDGERIETVPFVLGQAAGRPVAHPALSAAERLAAFRNAAPVLDGDLAGLAAAAAGQRADAGARLGRMAAERDDAIRERNGFAAELERSAREARVQDAFWRARLAGLLASRSWRMTNGLRARFGGIDSRALAAMPPERAVDVVLGSVWWELAAPIRVASRALRRLTERGKARRAAPDMRPSIGSALFGGKKE